MNSTYVIFISFVLLLKWSACSPSVHWAAPCSYEILQMNNKSYRAFIRQIVKTTTEELNGTHLPTFSIMMRFSMIMVSFTSSCCFTFCPKENNSVFTFFFLVKTAFSCAVVWVSYPFLNNIPWFCRAASYTQGYINSEECIWSNCRNENTDKRSLHLYMYSSKRNSESNGLTYYRRTQR